MKDKYAIEFNNNQVLITNSNVPTLTNGQRIEFALDSPIKDVFKLFIDGGETITGKLINIHLI